MPAGAARKRIAYQGKAAAPGCFEQHRLGISFERARDRAEPCGPVPPLDLRVVELVDKGTQPVTIIIDRRLGRPFDGLVHQNPSRALL